MEGRGSSLQKGNAFPSRRLSLPIIRLNAVHRSNPFFKRLDHRPGNLPLHRTHHSRMNRFSKLEIHREIHFGELRAHRLQLPYRVKVLKGGHGPAILVARLVAQRAFSAPRPNRPVCLVAVDFGEEGLAKRAVADCEVGSGGVAGGAVAGGHG